MEDGFENNSNTIRQNRDYLDRPRLHALLKEAIEYPLVIVCAGSGYGKTHAVHSFLKEYRAHTTWMQISERDNIESRFWENYTSQVSLLWPEKGARLLEIGLPGTDEAFSQYAVIRQEVASQPGKHIRVFDDIHLLHNPDIIHFFDRVANMPMSSPTMILITRTMPDINLIGMIMRGKVFTIHEDVLCFTEDEIAKYFSQLKLSVARGDIRNIYDDTEGWAFAVNLIGHSLTKKGKYERYALEAMKKNIFRLIEEEMLQTTSGPLYRFLLRISLIDHLAVSLIKELAKSAAGPVDDLLREMELLNAYIRYDYNMDSYLIHHLFRDYLRQKQAQVLTDEERKQTYQAAAVWCDSNGYHTDALSYYEKSLDFDAIINKIISLNVQFPFDLAQYAMEIFDRMPDEVKSRNVLFPSMYIKLKMNLGQFEEAHVSAEQFADDYQARPGTPERDRALAAIYAYWGLLRMNMCTYNDVYDFDLYFKKMDEYFNKNPFRIIGSYKLTSMTSRASVVGTNRPGAMEEFIGAISRSGPYLSHMLNGFHDGFEDLVRGELCFNQMEFNEAVQCFKQSIAKAQESDQYVTQNRALVYLMHIDIAGGDFASANAKLMKMEEMLSEKDNGVRYTMYDIANSFYHLVLGMPENVPEWLKGDFSSFSHPSFLENYANRIRVRYHYQSRQYGKLLTFIENALKHPSILYDKIELKVLQALSFYHLKRRSEAITALTEAYHLAESNKLISLFVQFEKDMHTFISAVLKDETCTIPQKWLEDIGQKSSTLAKRKAKIISEYRLANNLENDITLTEREIAILRDLSNGLSRIEISSNRNIAFNMIKLSINSIFEKLFVSNLPEAIRAAVDRGII